MGPPDEEPVPPPENDQGPPLFDFFGLGQHVLAPIAEHTNNPALEWQQDQMVQIEQANQFDAWPEDEPAN